MLLPALSWTAAVLAGVFLKNTGAVPRLGVVALSAATALLSASSILVRIKAAVFTVLLFDIAKSYREKETRMLEVVLCVLGPVVATSPEHGPSPANLAGLSCAVGGALWVFWFRERVRSSARYAAVWFGLGVTLGLATVSG